MIVLEPKRSYRYVTCYVFVCVHKKNNQEQHSRAAISKQKLSKHKAACMESRVDVHVYICNSENSLVLTYLNPKRGNQDKVQGERRGGA